MVWFPHLLAIEQFTLTPHGNQESETAYNYDVTQIFLRKIPNREAKVALDVEVKPMAVHYAAT